MEEFFTKDKANEGKVLPLYNPETGEKSQHWLKVLGVDSDAYFKAETAMQRAMPGIQAEAKGLDGAEAQLTFVADKQKEWKRKIVAAVIADWSFDKPCNEEEKIDFLTKAPQIVTAVDGFISDRRLFFSLGQANSSNSQEQNSN